MTALGQNWMRDQFGWEGAVGSSLSLSATNAKTATSIIRIAATFERFPPSIA